MVLGLIGTIFAVSGYRRVKFNHQIQCPMENVLMRRRILPLDESSEDDLLYEFSMDAIHLPQKSNQGWCKFSLWGFSAGKTIISAEAVDLDTEKTWARIDVTEQVSSATTKSFNLKEPFHYETTLSGYTEVVIGIKEDYSHNHNVDFNFIFRSNKERPDFVRATGPTYIVWFWLPLTMTFVVCACLFAMHKLENYGIEQKKKRYDFRVESGLKYGDPGDFSRDQLRKFKSRLAAISISTPQSPRRSRAMYNISV
ncbi:Oidioi.mRNA.OKI2018_I69.chr1.g3736.t1.cds [Oikopleura dioica]|uniref:Oidioi.mRNA.OKI2018_I69.chr1.g3736.t1.cds n=1 Tax=Oikopleura dioica TaxID=34765 RepID=A0ABN7SZD3_OIKDI|nr:Oidioi.mRNA.OKI2018_I69.chr1.g3736.t1.cds [Oikopleura dioica]